MTMGECRCGHTGEGPHPCHGRAYTCRKPARERFYGARMAALAGVQMKVVCQRTFACEECWEATASERQNGVANQDERT